MRKYLRMSSKAKLLLKLASHSSDANWTLDEAMVLLAQNGFSQTGGKGSHRVFTHPEYDSAIVLAAHGKKIKTGYVRAIRDALHNIKNKK